MASFKRPTTFLTALRDINPTKYEHFFPLMTLTQVLNYLVIESNRLLLVVVVDRRPR
jgi:hypothetical protein